MGAGSWRHALVLGLAWLAYFTLHSALASLAAKRWCARHWPSAMPFYRALFNGVALLTLLPVAWLMLRTAWPPVWAWTGAGAWLANAVALAALLGALATRSAYDLRAFIGWPPMKTATPTGDGQPFALSALHRHVRHPWYFTGLVLLWTRDMDVALLTTALLTTAYLGVGARLEENKLIDAYGDAYRRYRARVPGLLPWPGKSLSAREAAELVAAANRPAGNDAREPD